MESLHPFKGATTMLLREYAAITTYATHILDTMHAQQT